MPTVDPSTQFLSLVEGPEDAIPLDQATLLMAAHAKPSLDVAARMQQLDTLADGCDESSIDGLVHHLFSRLGFTGNREDYDDPRNSMLDEVLDRRIGIPITLSVLALEVGRRVGVPLCGVGMPGHFLVATTDGRFVDPFEGGRQLDADGCREQFHAVLGDDAPWSDAYLAPVGKRVILARMLANLRQLYTAADDLTSLSWVLRLRAGIPGIDPDERLELVEVLSALGRYDEAARVLDQLARDEAVRGERAAKIDADELRGRALRLRARLN
jgi:regulator of sirC expression with transglutaminase-like and TPR domain